MSDKRLIERAQTTGLNLFSNIGGMADVKDRSYEFIYNSQNDAVEKFMYLLDSEELYMDDFICSGLRGKTIMYNPAKDPPSKIPHKDAVLKVLNGRPIIVRFSADTDEEGNYKILLAWGGKTADKKYSLIFATSNEPPYNKVQKSLIDYLKRGCIRWTKNTQTK